MLANTITTASAEPFSILNAQCSIQKVAIFRALFLGDLLMTVPAWRALRERFPKAEITLIGLPWAASLLPHIAPTIDRFLVFPGYPGIVEVPVQAERTAHFLDEQRRYGYDLALQMHGDGSVSNGFVADLGARASLGYALRGDARLTHGAAVRAEIHEARRWLDLIALTGASTDETRTGFTLAPQDETRATELLAPVSRASAPLVALHVGAKDAARRWPAERFARLANALHDEYNAQIILTGTEGERSLTSVVREMARAPVLDLTGATGVGVFAALLTQIDLLVTNDTGASHLAAAVESPSVILFGPTRPAQWAPLNRALHRVVDASAHAPPDTDGATALARLPVEAVLEACRQQLDHRRPTTDDRYAPGRPLAFELGGRTR